MKAALATLVVLLLVANGWALLRRGSPSDVTADRTAIEAAAASSASSASAAASATSRLAVVPPTASLAAALAHSDPAAMRDALRAAGVGEARVRAIVEGVLRQRYRAADHAKRLGRIAQWWRETSPSTLGQPPVEGDQALLKELVTEPVLALFGADPRALENAERRYDFLPPSKRRLLAQIDLDYTDLGAAEMQPVMGGQLRADQQRQELLAAEKRKDILAALDPAERAEYELRFGGTAFLTANRFANMPEATEAEFRAIKPLVDDLSERARVLSETGGENWTVAYADLQQRTVDQIVAAVGYERALEYVWGGDGPSKTIRDALQGEGLPAAAFAPLMQLAAETGVKAGAIHRDEALTGPQKEAALRALQATVRPQHDGLVPPAHQGRLPDRGIGWFNDLGAGRYRVLQTGVGGSSGPMEIAGQSVTSRPTGRPPTWVLPRRVP